MQHTTNESLSLPCGMSAAMVMSGADLLSEANNGHGIQSVSEGLTVINLV